MAGQHYLAASGTLVFGPTLPEASFEVTILDDSAADGICGLLLRGRG